MTTTPQPAEGREIRAITCPECDGMGEWDTGPHNTSSHGGPADPEYRQVICPECEGTGKVLAEVEPITLDDLDAALALVSRVLPGYGIHLHIGFVNSDNSTAEVWERKPPVGANRVREEATAKLPAIAVCLALIRALISTHPHTAGEG